MTKIPSDEIAKPGLHTDKLGFTFVWDNHFLRGIFPSSINLVKSYFVSGFIDEIVSKKLFPRTWISEFENDQFGMILEHEMIIPILYATEWNYEMLKDAALMVLDIAQVAWKYGYNMVDCHKLNVLFFNNRPMYVDLGSFVPMEDGCTGWNPYSSFLRSYYYILSIWSDGASTMAKRMMAPGLECSEYDYYIYKSWFYRSFPKFIRWKLLFQESNCRLAVWGYDTVAKRGGKELRLAKWLVNMLKLSPSQKLNSIKKTIQSKKIYSNSKTYTSPLYDNLINIINEKCEDCKSATFINNTQFNYYPLLLKQTRVNNIISIQENDLVSNREYRFSRQSEVGFSSTSFRLLNNTILVRGRFPEIRLKSDLVILPSLKIEKGEYAIHNAVVFIEYCMCYAIKHFIIIVNQTEEEMIQRLLGNYKMDIIPLYFTSNSINEGEINNTVALILHL